MSSIKERLQDILIRDNLISAQDLTRALDEQKKIGGELSKILLKLKLIGEEQLTLVLSEVLELPVINVSRLKLDPAMLKLIPQEMAVKNNLIPISQLGDFLTVAMVDPMDIFVIDNLKALTGHTISPVLARPKDIQQMVQKHYGAAPAPDESLDSIIKDIRDAEDMELIKDGSKSLEATEIESLIQEAPIIKLTNTIVQQAISARASDVFIEPMERSLRIRYRIDGMLREIDQMSKVLHFPIVSRIKVISNLDISEHRLPQDGRFKSVSGDKEVDFRVSVLPTAMGEKIVLRVLDKNLEMIDVEKLGFEPKSLARLKEACQRPHGMILACGPTGSGKTTTLYSIMKYIDSPGKNIITVEDPVEYQMKGLNQVNVRAEVGLTFASSLRSILRQDPDIIMIGEIRDSDTLNIAVKAALTGHFVLSSLHTTTGPGSLTRMINMGVEPFLLCSSLIGIVAQRLLRRICDKCKESYQITQTLYDKLNFKYFAPDKDLTFYRGKGCPHCYNTGYKGRVGITEILVMSPKLKEMLLADAGELAIKKVSRQEGMITMREDGLLKAAKGLTTIEEVYRVTAADEPLE